ncbi:MAG: ATP-binding cassette domain-containing protein [Candidatus Cloacimonetes bacterium]|nr:ATP-binding cassette domain-containing protein [Candidatus Cloacimonadota bacterium]
MTDFLELREVNWGTVEDKVLMDISFSLSEGRSAVICGSPDSGKSVLLKVIGGMLPPDTGQVFYRGREVYAGNEEDIKKVRREIAFVFHQGVHLANIILRENLLLPVKYHYPDYKSRQFNQEISYYLDYFNLGNILEHRPAEVPEIRRKLLNFIRAFIMKPRLILVDEPLFNLDLRSQKMVITKLKEFRQQGTSFLLATNSGDVMKAMADELIVMSDGRIEKIINVRESGIPVRIGDLEFSDLVGVEDEI